MRPLKGACRNCLVVVDAETLDARRYCSKCAALPQRVECPECGAPRDASEPECPGCRARAARVDRAHEPGMLGAWYTLLTWIETARHATGLTSDEALAEDLWTALEGVKVGSLARLRVELAKEAMAALEPGTPVAKAARGLRVSRTTVRKLAKESDRPMPKVPPPEWYGGDIVEAEPGDEQQTA